MRLENFVLELLYHHDCVVIPQWGGLVANYRAARLNAVSHVISPPSKHIGFNGHLKSDDGLLAHHMGMVLGIAHTDAKAIILEQVSQMKAELLKQDRVVWEKIGIFYSDAQGAIQFMPQDQENFLLDSFGLHPIQLKAIERMTQLETPTARPIESTPNKNWNWKYAAAALAPVVLAGGLWWASVQQPSDSVSWATLNPFRSSIQTSAYTLRNPQLPWQNPLVVEEPMLVLGPDKPVKKEVVVNPKTSAQQVHDKSGYAVIGGAFKIEDNAHHFLEQLRKEGFDAEFVNTSKQIHLVAYGVYQTRAEAAQAAANLRSAESKNVWIKQL
jgi:CCDC81-like prokaryotic HU domain 1/CCDC81-like prokaryotic HU domain 2/SPOR domain